jgi:hypothetical protein
VAFAVSNCFVCGRVTPSWLSSDASESYDASSDAMAYCPDGREPQVVEASEAILECHSLSEQEHLLEGLTITLVGSHSAAP